MCCSYDEKATQALRTELLGGAKTFYKVLSIDDERNVVSPFRAHPVAVVDGAIVSDREGISREPHEQYEVGRGIHVCTTEEAANGLCEINSFALPVVCRAEDLVAADGERDAVFIRVFADEAELKRRASAVELIEVDDSFDDDDDEDDDWDDDDYDDFDDDEDDEDWDDE